MYQRRRAAAWPLTACPAAPPWPQRLCAGGGLASGAPEAQRGRVNHPLRSRAPLNKRSSSRSFRVSSRASRSSFCARTRAVSAGSVCGGSNSCCHAPSSSRDAPLCSSARPARCAAPAPRCAPRAPPPPRAPPQPPPPPQPQLQEQPHASVQNGTHRHARGAAARTQLLVEAAASLQLRRGLRKQRPLLRDGAPQRRGGGRQQRQMRRRARLQVSRPRPLRAL